MIDIHAHILPGLDDGATDIEDAVEMARIAWQNGTTAIIATPHCNLPGTYDNYFGKAYIDVYDQTVEAVRKAGLDIQILPGMEAFATYDLPDLIVDQKIMPLNQSRYILIEFAFEENPDYAEDILSRVKAVGARPVIAHPERYGFIQDDMRSGMRIVKKWSREGYIFQINKSSFLGKFGRGTMDTAYKLLDNGIVTAIASDAHGVEFRTTNMLDVYEELEKSYSRKELQILFQENPLRICNNEPILKKRM